MCELCDARKATTKLKKDGETYDVCRQCKVEEYEWNI